MKINFTKEMIKDSFYSLEPVNWLLKATGLSNICRKGLQLTVSTSIVRSIILIIFFGILNTLCMIYKMSTFIGSPRTGLVKFSDVIQLIYWLSYFEYIFNIFVVYKYGRHSLLKYFRDFDYIDVMLGVPSYDKMRSTIFKNTVFSIAIFFFNCIFDYVLWVSIEGWKAPTVYAVEYIYFFLNMLMVLDFISHVVQVEYRLKIINAFLQDYDNTNVKISIVDINNSAVSNKNGRVYKPIDTFNTLNCNQYLDTAWFNQCYLMLLEQVSYLNTSFGLRILIYCVNLLIHMISWLNLAIRITDGTMIQAGGKVVLDRESSLIWLLMPSIASISRTLNYEIMAIILINRCEKTYKQSENILKTIDALLSSKKNYCHLKSNLLEIRNLLITRPIKFHAGKFFNIDYTLLVSLNSVVVTYPVIMLQSMA